MDKFSVRFKELKRKNRYTYKQLGEIFNVKMNTVQLYASGVSKPRYEILLAIADLFDVSLDYLTGRSDDPKRY